MHFTCHRVDHDRLFHAISLRNAELLNAPIIESDTLYPYHIPVPSLRTIPVYLSHCGPNRHQDTSNHAGMPGLPCPMLSSGCAQVMIKTNTTETKLNTRRSIHY